MHADFGQPFEIRMHRDATLTDHNAIFRHARRKTLSRGQRRFEGLEVAIIDADQTAG